MFKNRDKNKGAKNNVQAKKNTTENAGSTPRPPSTPATTTSSAAVPTTSSPRAPTTSSPPVATTSSPPAPTTPRRPSTASTTSTASKISIATVGQIGRWSSRARKNAIAFVPEDGVTEEMLKLHERLGSSEHDVTPEPPPTPPTTAVVVAQKQQPLQKQQPTADKDAYDFLPRPFRAHMADIKKRRMRKLIETMNSPKEIYDISEKEKRVKFAPHGTLIFHILELTKLAVNDSSFVRSLPLSFYCVLSIGTLKRTSKIVHSRTTRRIRVDYTAHFSIEVPEWRESNLNRFIVELWSYQDPEMHYIVGSVEIHAYEFVRNQHAIQRFQLWSDGIKVGKVYCEYAFSYGYFGYGHSNYLKNPNNPIMETACHSMYPRIRIDPEVDLVDSVYRVRLPQQLKVFTFNSLILEFNDAIETESKRTKKRLEDMTTKPIVVQLVSFEDDKPVHCKVHMNIYQKEVQPDFNDTFGEFICFGSRKTRLDYLSNIVPGRMRDLYENDEAAALFRPFRNNKEAEKIQAAEINHPGYLVHPTKASCIDSLGITTLTGEDENFQSYFPSLRRGQGYLNAFFGYEAKPTPNEFLNDMDAPLYKEAGIRRRRNWRNCCRWFRVLIFRIGALLNKLYNFIFPEIRKPPPVPEISVTTPTPPGSTTKVYTYFAKESKDLGATKLDRLQSQTAALMQIADRRHDDSDEHSENSSSGTEEETIGTKQADLLRKERQLRAGIGKSPENR